MEPSHTSEKMTDEDIVQRVLQGETKLFEIIIRRYNNYLYKVGRSCGYDHSDTETLMSDTYLKAYLHLKDMKGCASFKVWIIKIMLSRCHYQKPDCRLQQQFTVETEMS